MRAEYIEKLQVISDKMRELYSNAIGDVEMVAFCRTLDFYRGMEYGEVLTCIKDKTCKDLDFIKQCVPNVAGFTKVFLSDYLPPDKIFAIPINGVWFVNGVDVMENIRHYGE